MTDAAWVENICRRIVLLNAEAQAEFDKNYKTKSERRQGRMRFAALNLDRAMWRTQLVNLDKATGHAAQHVEHQALPIFASASNGHDAAADAVENCEGEIEAERLHQQCSSDLGEPDLSTLSVQPIIDPGAFDDEEGPKHTVSRGFTILDAPDPPTWQEPDLGVMRLSRREPPPFPLAVLGPFSSWVAETAESAACPPDYVAAPLLALASALIGNARWAQAAPGWSEPPHLWTCVVGDSGEGKSPGSDSILRDILPKVERRMLGDFPDRLRDWKVAAEQSKFRDDGWRDDVRAAKKNGQPPPLPPREVLLPEPQAPRVRQNDVTVERVATLLAGAAPKGLLIVRDEIAGWMGDMTRYNDGGRAFWLECYGGRPYRVERQKHPHPIDVPHLAVSVYGGAQPQRLDGLFNAADDGLFSRLMWFWPKPVPFRLGRETTRADWAIERLDRLRLLELAQPSMPGQHPIPILVPLVVDMQPAMEDFARQMQVEQRISGGLLVSAFGKARGLALRLSLVLELLWWCGGDDGLAAPPIEIGARAFLAASSFVQSYVLAMAARVYGDATASQIDRNAATLARWIVRTKATEVHVRQLQREVRLPGLKSAEDIHAAAKVLIEADWLKPPAIGKQAQGAPRAAYPVNPAIRTVDMRETN